MNDLFLGERHDAGGKVARRWPDDVMVRADFGGERGCYRYSLSCIWSPDLPLVMWLMMNPSVADVNIADPTLSRCLAFSRKWRSTSGLPFGGMLIGNIFAYRATDNRELLRVPDPVGPKNETMLMSMSASADFVVLAYGKPPKPLHQQGQHIAELMQEWDVDMRTIHLTADGTPGHPLYVPGDRLPEPYKLPHAG